jgi:hypothetical protein
MCEGDGALFRLATYLDHSRSRQLVVVMCGKLQPVLKLVMLLKLVGE